MNTHTRKANYDVNEHSLCSENSFRQVEPNDNPWVIPEEGPYERDPVEDEPYEGDPTEDEPYEGDPVEDEPYEGDPIEDEPYVEDPVEDSPSIEICDY